MMTFYAAAGSYQIRNEDGKDMPYIMRLGKLQPVSIPEFSIWSMLLWVNQMKMLYSSCPPEMRDTLLHHTQETVKELTELSEKFEMN